MTRVRLRLLLGGGLLLGAAAIALTLTQSPIAVTRVSTAASAFMGEAARTTRVCQAGETLPRGTSAIRLRTEAFLGPRVRVDVLARSRVIAHGERGTGWTGGAVTVPVNASSRPWSDVELCFTLFGNGDEAVQLLGEPTGRTRAARGSGGPLDGRVRVEDLRPASMSWWSLAPQVARRMGLGRAAAGTWVALLAIALMGGLLALCWRLLVRELT